MDVILFNDVSLFESNKTIIYGQYKYLLTSIKINTKLKYTIVFCKKRKDFYIEINSKINIINEIIFMCGEKIVDKKKNILVFFPFENCDLNLNSDSVIISTMCKDYAFRLDEWIKYNLNLGFTGIIIFDNDENKSNKINEPLNCQNQQNKVSTSDICKKYKGKVYCVKFSYSPINENHWNTIQRITLHIGVNAFRNKCGKIALIDADEFIYIPKKTNIIDFLSNYKGKTLTIKSNILTNKNDNDIVNNNILDLCLYVGKNMYTKTIIDTSKIKPNEFIITPHKHPTQILLDKDKIIHYHCWVNSRYKYKQNMPKIDFLQI